jgi:hypothetical protein
MTRFLDNNALKQVKFTLGKEGVGLTPAMDTEDDNNMEYSQNIHRL